MTKLENWWKALSVLVALGAMAAAPVAAEVTISTATYSTDTTWTKANGPYVITGKVTVQETATLTIEAGTEVRFGDSGWLHATGVLTAVGAEGDSIVFTTTQTSPQNGAWDGILLEGTAASASRLERCVLSYGAGSSGTSNSLLKLKQCAATVTGCAIRHSKNYGIQIDAEYSAEAAGPTVRDCAIEVTADYALFIQSTSAQRRVDLNRVAASVTGNTFSMNGASYVNIRNSIGLGTMTLAEDYTWADIDGKQVDVDGTIIAPDDVYDENGFVLDDWVTLTVPAGSLIEFDSGELQIEGELVARGTLADTIMFVGRDRSPNEWSGIDIEGENAQAVLAHCDFRHVSNPLYIANGAQAQVSHCDLRRAYYGGLSIYRASATIDTCRISAGRGNVAVLVDEVEHLPYLRGNSIEGADGAAIVLEDSPLDPAELDRLSGNTVSGNSVDAIVLDRMALADDYTWQEQVDGIEVRLQELTVPEGVSLTVPPGTTVRRGPSSGTLRVEGVLDATGTEGEPILFTGPQSPSCPLVFEGVGASGSRLEWCDFQIPNAHDGQVQVTDAAVTIDHCTFADFGDLGLRIDASYTEDHPGPAVTNNLFEGSGRPPSVVNSDDYHGLLLEATQEPIDLNGLSGHISGNTFTGTPPALGVLTLAADYTWGQIDGAWPDMILGRIAVPEFGYVRPAIELTIPAGVEINLWQAGFEVAGSLVAVGTEAEPIVLTAWQGSSSGENMIRFAEGARGSVEHCELRLEAFLAGIEIDNADVQVRNCRFLSMGSKQGSRTGVVIDDLTDRRPAIQGCEFAVNGTGIWTKGDPQLPLISGNTFSGNLVGLAIDAPSFDPARFDSINGNSAVGNTYDLVLANVTLTDDFHWSPVDSMDLAIDGTLRVPAGIRLTVPPGAALPGAVSWGSTSANLEVLGTLDAVGTADSPITMGPFYGSGVFFNGEGASASRLKWCNVSGTVISFYNYRVLRIADASPSIVHCTIHAPDRSQARMVSISGTMEITGTGDTTSTTKPVIAYTRFSGDHLGIEIEDALPELRNNAFVQGGFLSAYGDLAATHPVDATGNWWGHATGPTHTSNPDGRGTGVGDNILFETWLDHDPTQGAGLAHLGDVDLNGRITIRDALIVAAYAVNSGIALPPGADIAGGDANGDGEITIADALVIATYVVDSTNQSLPPWLRAKPALLALGELEPGERATVRVQPDQLARAYQVRLTWAPEELQLVGVSGGSLAHRPAGLHQEPGLVVLAEVGAGILTPVALEFEAKSPTMGLLQQQSEALAGNLETAAVTLSVSQLPQRYALTQNFPNPFNPTTTIRYDLPAEGPVSLKVYGLQGQVVRSLVRQVQAPGAYRVQWDGRDDGGRPVASGLYLYRLDAGGHHMVQKMLLLK